VTLAKFYESLHETTGLGDLVQHLDISIQEKQVQQFHQHNENVLAGIRDLVPHLRSIHWAAAPTFGNIFLDQIKTFEELEVMVLATTSSKYFDLLEMKNLKKVYLQILGDDNNLEKVTESASSVRQLSLDTFCINVCAPSPLLINFIQSIKAKEVILRIRHAVDLMSRSLAALDPSITSHMALYNSRRSPLILDSQLNRFTRLSHLTLVSSIDVDKSFFKTILRTPLIYLGLGVGFDLDAQNLIDALKDPDSAKQLEELDLDNIDFEEQSEEEFLLGELPDCWTDRCTMEHVAELRSIARTSGFELSGSAMEAQETCRRILAAGEE
jgi:hypothetical protein